MSGLKLAFTIAVGVYLAVMLGMFAFQRSLQYFPSHQAPAPKAMGLAQVSVIELTAKDGIKSQLWFAPARAGMRTILFFHGNAGEVAGRADHMRAYMQQGYGAAFVSYRGFGASHDKITEAGLMQDAQAGYDWLIAQGVSPRNLIVVGESLGTGVAVQLAAANPVAALALGAPYSSTVDVAAASYPWLPVRLLMLDQFRSDLAIGRITAPILIQHGDADRVIPYRFGQRLFSLAGKQAQFITLKGRGHEALFDSDTWAREMAFFAALPKS